MDGRSIVETLAQALAQFETIGMPARNLAARTRGEYSRDLWDVLSYLEQNGITRLDEVRPRALEGYLAEFDRRGLQGRTRNRKVHTLKTFFKWMVGQEFLVFNPAAQHVAPRVIKKEPRYLSEEEYRRLLGRAVIMHEMPRLLRCFSKLACAFPNLLVLHSAMLNCPSASRVTSS